MSWKSWLQGTAAAGLLTLGTACTAHWVVASPPPHPQTIVVREPPPEPVEVVPPRPGEHYVWLRGHWMWREQADRYEWAPGHWQYTGNDEHARDEHADHRDHDERGHDGNARREDHDHEGENVHVYGRPPRDREERVPPRPGEDYEWNRGHWVWHQNTREYQWEAGRWERRARGASEHKPDDHGRGAGEHNKPDNNGRGAGEHKPDSNGRGEPPRTAKPRPEVKPVAQPTTKPVAGPPAKPVIGAPAKPLVRPQPGAEPGAKGAPGRAVVFVNKQPPRDRAEKVPPRPMAGEVWIAGHWDWRKNDYVWTPGHYAVPARGFHAWVPGRWAHEARGWYYIEGYWR